MSRMKSRPASTAAASVTLIVASLGIVVARPALCGNFGRRRQDAAYWHDILASGYDTRAARARARSAPCWSIAPKRLNESRHSFRPIADRDPAYRQSPHGAVQLALCARP